MTSRIEKQQQERAKTLLSRGFSHAAVSRRLGLHRATVARIAFDDGVQTERRDDLPPGYDERQKHRCRGCGRMVYLWPCLACSLDDNCRAKSSTCNSNRPARHLADHPARHCQ